MMYKTKFIQEICLEETSKSLSSKDIFMEKNNSLVKQIRDFGIGPIVGMLIGTLTVPITTRLVSPEEFGKSSLFTLLQTIFNLVILLGFDQSYVRFYNQKEINKRKLLYNCLIFPVILCFFLVLILIVFRKSILFFMFGQYDTLIAVSLVFFLPALMFNRFAMLTIRMELRGKLYSFLNIFQQIITFFSLLIFLFFYERTFKSIVLSTVVATILTSIVSILCSKQFFSFKDYVFDKILIKELVKFGLPLLPAGILTWVMNSFDKIGLRTWSSFEELGLYSAAFKIVALLTVIQNIFSTSWTPLAYKWYEEKVPNKKFEEVGTIIISLMSIMFSVIIVFRYVIMFFLGPEYRNTANIFVFLLFNPALYTTLEVTGQGLGFKKKSIYSLISSAIAASINFIGNFLLIPKYGAIGAAISTCISYLIFFFTKTLISRRIWFKFSIKKYIINIVLLLFFGINMMTLQNRIIEYSLFFIVCIYNAYNLFNVYKDRKKQSVSVSQEQN